MQLDSYKHRSFWGQLPLLCLGVIYIVHNIKPYFLSVNQFLCGIIGAKLFTFTAFIFNINYVINRRNDRSLMCILQMKRKTLVWKSDVRYSLMRAFGDAVVITCVFMVVSILKYNDINSLINAVLAGIAVFMQLGAGYILIELTDWMAGSATAGFVILSAWGICCAFSPFISQIYAGFSIAENILVYDIKMIITKLIGLIAVNGMLIAIGCIFSGKKEFI